MIQERHFLNLKNINNLWQSRFVSSKYKYDKQKQIKNFLQGGLLFRFDNNTALIEKCFSVKILWKTILK
ncbi:hypothetical protein ATZ36_05350 [Candidatus Endomicrobiellum trichonymphae]|uniref:Uncharacterized protein n=1 Tax=Endomicrobium trichonymphae TaxID=1408204 RepID=A0A1E5IJW2_ENDTX|nr:hypothetical protein ATZ36_05350 [Candidatus Endomicrobium trichonymphae]